VQIGDIALAEGLPIYELHSAGGDLEDVFFALTEGTNRNLGPSTGSATVGGAA